MRKKQSMPDFLKFSARLELNKIQGELEKPNIYQTANAAEELMLRCFPEIALHLTKLDVLCDQHTHNPYAILHHAYYLGFFTGRSGLAAEISPTFAHNFAKYAEYLKSFSKKGVQKRQLRAQERREEVRKVASPYIEGFRKGEYKSRNKALQQIQERIEKELGYKPSINTIRYDTENMWPINRARPSQKSRHAPTQRPNAARI